MPKKTEDDGSGKSLLSFIFRSKNKKESGEEQPAQEKPAPKPRKPRTTSSKKTEEPKKAPSRAKSSTRSTKKDTKDAPAAAAKKSGIEKQLADAGITDFAWRTPSKEASRPKGRTSAKAGTSADKKEANADPVRRSRSRRRENGEERPITAADAFNVKPPARVKPSRKEDAPEREKPRKKSEPAATKRTAERPAAKPRTTRATKPQAPKKEPMPAALFERNPIEIGDSEPQVITKDGMPLLVNNRKVIPPIMFCSTLFDADSKKQVGEQIKMAAQRGIHTFVLLFEFEVGTSLSSKVSAATDLIEEVRKSDSKAQVIFRVVFTAPSRWPSAYPKAKYKRLDGSIAEPSFCDDAFWGDAEKELREFCKAIRKERDLKPVLGLHLERGEWFVSKDDGYDTSEAATDRFRIWLRHRYRNDLVALRAAWFDGSVQFDTAEVPEHKSESHPDAEFVRTDRKARRWVDYHLFISDTIADRIGQLAYACKETTDGGILCGVSYGYTFEWSYPGNGHLALGKLLRCPDLDYIAGPPSYKNREPGGTCPFPAPIDSFPLNGKLYVSEEDFKTPISDRKEPDDFNPVMKTPQALESVHWRGIGAALAHSGALAWMDTWGNGWLSSPKIWERGEQVREILIKRIEHPPAAPDAALFIDERSLAYLADQRAFAALVQNVREAMMRCGMSVGFYLLSDLAHREKFPESKLYVFVNAWDIRPEVRSAIKTRLQRDEKVLFWLYTAGLFEGGRDSLERVREVTGIALKPQPFHSKSGTTVLNRNHPLCNSLPDKALAEGGGLEPSYFAIPEDGLVLGEYIDSGLPSFTMRQFEGENNDGGWTSVFLGEPVVTPGFIRTLGEMANAHIWTMSEDVLHVRPPFLTLHASGSGKRTIALPNNWVAYDLTGGEWLSVEGSSLRFEATDGSTICLAVGPKSEVEALLERSSDPPVFDELPDKRENTMRWDAVNFDVAIMKLDEWVEESWSEDFADDLLLKPSMLDVDEEPDAAHLEYNQSRARRKRKGGGYEPIRGRRRSDSESGGVGVTFRKPQ